MTDSLQDGTGKIERLYLDFDSFFATAEQHFNPKLRGRPVGVVPLDTPNTGCIAISREAKALGLKSNASIRDARQLIPDMIFVVARHDVYVRLHNRILDVIGACLPIAHVRSIDEVVCTLTADEAAEGSALALRIKHALQVNFSDVLTCSIGMASTELLAKIAAEMNKPDGFALIDASNLPAALNHIPLQKLPGISDGIAARLLRAGVDDFASLWQLAPKQARAIWGNVEGERFWNGLHGYHVQRPETQKRAFGHSRMLPVEWRNTDKIAICARQLCLSAGRRLRRTQFCASKLSLSFRGGGYRGAVNSRNDDQRWIHEGRVMPARDDHTFATALSDCLRMADRTCKFTPRSVSVVLHGLIEQEAVIGDLFENQLCDTNASSQAQQRRNWERVSDVMDRLRLLYGPEIISLGPHVDVPGGYLGAKIAFGRIPDLTDFNSAPVPDEQTHFCSV